jgi:DUF4097 and DUF4098 domain-containing protein YvlB
MMSKSVCCLLTVLCGLAGVPMAAADDCRYEEPREAVLDAAGADQLRVEAVAGSLRIEGREGLTNVQIHGTACASSKDMLKDIKLETDRHRDTLEVVAKIPDSSGWRDSQAHLDLVIEVPRSLALDVQDGSGSATFRNVGALSLKDGSGEIDIRDAGGSVEITDGSGEVELVGVEGDVWISDGSGELDIRKVTGELTIEQDGSGEITIEDVGGNVEIGEDGSGGIIISRVGGSVSIDEDGSGSIDVSHVTGDLRVGQDGSGGIGFEDVGGRVRVP